MRKKQEKDDFSFLDIENLDFSFLDFNLDDIKLDIDNLDFSFLDFNLEDITKKKRGGGKK